MGKNKLLFIGIGVLIVASIIFSTSQVVAGKAEQKPVKCTSWDLAADYKLYPNQANPNPDSCGNPAVWHFLRVDPARQNYTLLNVFSYDFHGFPEIQQWSTDSVVGSMPCVAINGTGHEVRPSGYNIIWPAASVNVHPAPTEFGAVGWRSPIDGYVMVSGFVSDMDAGCGNGIRWFIDQNSTNLLSGEIQNGGQESFPRSRIRVHVNDFLYFVIDQKGGDYGCDSTQLDVRIRTGRK